MELLERFKSTIVNRNTPSFEVVKAFNDVMIQKFNNSISNSNDTLLNRIQGVRMNGFGYVLPDFTSEKSISQGYLANDTVYSIIKLISKSCSFPSWGVYKVVDETSYKRYNALLKKANQKDYIEIRDLRQKSLKLDESHYLNGVFGNPNNQQGESEYIENLIGYKLINGNGYELGLRSELNGLGTLKKGMPTQLYVMPSNHMRIIGSDTFPVQVAGYYLQLDRNIQFSNEDILHSKYWNPNYSFLGDHLYGLSPLHAAWKLLQTDNQLQDTAYEQAYNKTVRGIVNYEAPSGMDLSSYQKIGSDQAGVTKERWAETQKEYRNQIIISLLKTSYTKIGLSAEDIDKLSSNNFTLPKLCNIYGVPSRLLNSEESATYNNYEQDNIRLITKVCIPELNQLKDARNRMFQNYWGLKGSGYVVDYDATVFTELQENRKDQVAFLKDAWWLTPNQKLDYMDEARNTDPNMDKIYIPTNLTPIEKANIIQQINTTQDVQDENPRTSI